MEKVRLGSIELVLASPITKGVAWIGQRELSEQIRACWTLVTDDDLPMTPRIVGKPGMGKTTLAHAAAQDIGRATYIVQCTMDTRPEDLIVTPVLAESGKIAYHASALVSAMIKGGVAILDEANRMSEKSWASLAPLLDNRRYVESLIAGVRIDAHPDFRACVTMNDDASTYEVPDYIISRLQPLIEVEFPNAEDERQILQYNVDFAPEDLLELTVTFLQEAHRHNLGYTLRDGVNIMRFALKLRQGGIGTDLNACFHRSVEQILGKDAFDFESRARGQFFLGDLRGLDAFTTTPEDFEDKDP